MARQLSGRDDAAVTDWMAFDEYLEARYPQRLRKLYSKPEIRTAYDVLRGTMPAGKVKHSLRVGTALARAGVRSRDVVDAGLFHDFLERGGDVRTIARTLGFSDQTIRMINLLSNDDKYENPYIGNGPLLHIQQVLSAPTIDEPTRNALVLIKISDRIDNLTRRADRDALSRGYIRKSRELLTYLFRSYTGDPVPALALRKRLKDLGVKIAKKHVYSTPDDPGLRPQAPPRYTPGQQQPGGNAHDPGLARPQGIDQAAAVRGF